VEGFEPAIPASERLQTHAFDRKWQFVLAVFSVYFGPNILILSRHHTISKTRLNCILLLLNSPTRSGSSRGTDLSLTMNWVKENFVVCCKPAPWILAEYSVSSNCSTMQATNLHGDHDSRAHKVNTDVSTLNEIELQHTFIHDRQCTYYVILRHFRSTIVVV